MQRFHVEHNKAHRLFLDTLAEQAPPFGLSLGSAALERLGLWYLELLHWSQRVNLTRILDPRQAALELVLDSLVAAPHLTGDGVVADIGSGAGLPGLVLAAVFEQRRFRLIEPQGKRVVFLQQCARRMGLNRVSVEQARWPDLSWSEDTDWLVSRAVFSDPQSWEPAAERLPATTSLMFWRGAESGSLPRGYMGRSIDIRLPGMNQVRHLLIGTPER
jgi:16S rRNA (guanine527-N7)-methyltransferase